MTPVLRIITACIALGSLCSVPLLAQFSSALPFGKNKKQYQRFEWKYVQSAHFDVYFHQDGEYLARYTAKQAEKALESISTTLSYTVTKRISFIVYNSHNQFQQTNVIDEFMDEGIGGVTELFKNRIVVPFEGDYAKFAHVIHHELVHAFLNDMFYGGSLQGAMSARAIIPLWMNEGFAEYESTGGLDIKTDMFMRDVAVSEYLRGLHQLNGYFAYRGGQSFWWYISDKYGKGKVGEVFNRFRANGNLEQVFKSSFGMTYQEMSEQWAKDMKKMYFPDFDRFEHADEFASRLTNHEKDGSFYNSSPAISPDGEQVAFISNRGGLFGLYVMNLRTKEINEILSSSQSADFEELNVVTPGITWSPDGKELAVGIKSAGYDVIYVVNVKEGDFEKLEFDFATIEDVSWSPSGEYIAFNGSPGTAQSDLYAYNLKTKRLDQLTNDVFSDFEPIWSPDSKQIYFFSDRGSNTTSGFTTDSYLMWDHDVEQRDVYRLDLEDGSITRITNDPSVGKTSMAITSDGRSLLITADYSGISNLWQLDLETGRRIARTNSLQEIAQISISQDASMLVFSSQNKVGYDLFLLRHPLDLKERDTLPLTKWKQLEIEQQNSLSSILAGAEIAEQEESVSYGGFDVSFERQQMVPPSEEGIRKPDESGPALAPSDEAAKDYKVTFTADLLNGSAGYSNWYGAQGVAQMLFSDVMGDHQIYVLLGLYLDLSNSNIYAQYGYRPEVIDYYFAGFHNAGYTYLPYTMDPLGSVYRMRNYGATITASYPLSKYQRFDLNLTVTSMSRENTNVPGYNDLTRFVVVPSLSWISDNTVLGYFSPVRGHRVNLTVDASPKVASNGIEFLTFRGDARQYFYIADNYTFVARGSGGISTGMDPQRFILGGVDNWFNRTFANGLWPFVNPEDFAFQRFAWPLRGFSLNERWGSSYALMNLEFRFPFLFALMAGPLPSLFQGLQAQFFFDGGGTWWSDGNSYNAFGLPAEDEFLYSMGFGLRSLALGLPLRLDVAWRHLPSGGFSPPIYLFSLGVDF